MTIIHEVIGNTVAEWDEETPLVWKMTARKKVREGMYEVDPYEFDFTRLQPGYENSFLMTLKAEIIEQRNSKALKTVHARHKEIRVLLERVRPKLQQTTKVAQIDLEFLKELRGLADVIAPSYLNFLRALFRTRPNSGIFSKGLVDSDFPTKRDKRSDFGALMDGILAKAMSRAVCVHILGSAERAWENGEIDIGLLCFTQLAFLAFTRPHSYRHLTVGDLIITKGEKTGEITGYQLLFSYPKTRVFVAPNGVPLKLPRRIGELLCLQRIHVLERYGHLVEKGKEKYLALFPNHYLDINNQWDSAEAQENYGRCSDGIFREHYLEPIRKISQTKFDFNALRHTIGTQLGLAGLGPAEIQAVLKHASPKTCRAYVDITFKDMVEQLSEAMDPAFIKHFPVIERFRSSSDPIDPKKMILSRDEYGTRKELTGECGALIACQYAPIRCYACHRFVPCYDVDHSINLDKVEAEINRYESAGRPFQAMLAIAKESRLYIMLVVAASDRYRQTLKNGAANE